MLRLSAILILATAVPGCSWQQAYSTAQEWQRSQCNRIVEQAERERCLANASMTYDEYRSRNDGSKKE